MCFWIYIRYIWNIYIQYCNQDIGTPNIRSRGVGGPGQLVRRSDINLAQLIGSPEPPVQRPSLNLAQFQST